MDKELVKSLISFIEEHQHLVDDEAQSEIRQYIHFDEWEKAYEILLFELIQNKRYPKPFFPETWLKFITDFGINKDPVVDGHLMTNFDKWVRGHQGD